MQIAIIDCGSKKVPDIANAMVDLGLMPQIIPLTGANEADFDSAVGIIVSGGAQRIVDESERRLLTEQTEFLSTVNKPVLGICLGHQILALRAGAAPYLGPERKGPEMISFVGSHPLIEGLKNSETFEENHTEGVTMPSGYRLLGTSPHYEVEVIAGKDKPFLGVQFHPEVSGEVGRKLLKNFVEIAKAHNP